MADRRITANTAITYDQVTSMDVFLIGRPTVDRKITALLLKKYVLANKAIGGSAAADITTNNGAQQLTNKTITRPNINGSTCLAEGADLNKLINLDTTQSELNRLYGLTVNADKLNFTANVSSDIQSQFNSKVTRYGTTEQVLYRYHTIKTLSGSTSASITNDAILTYHGLSKFIFRINAHSIIVQVWLVNTGTLVRTEKASTISYSCTTDGSDLNLDILYINGLDDLKTYQFNVAFTLNSYSGES